mgnify:CR=1 FL=1
MTASLDSATATEALAGPQPLGAFDLPAGMPADVFKHLKKVWVSGQQLRITRGSDTLDQFHAYFSNRKAPR